MVAIKVLHHSLLSPPRIWGHHLSIASVIPMPVLKCFHFEMSLLNRFITLIMKSFSGVSQNVQKVSANDVDLQCATNFEEIFQDFPFHNKVADDAFK